jgi:hypothetical protein
VKGLLQAALLLRDRFEAGELGEHGFSIARGKLEKRLTRDSRRALSWGLSTPLNRYV